MTNVWTKAEHVLTSEESLDYVARISWHIFGLALPFTSPTPSCIAAHVYCTRLRKFVSCALQDYFRFLGPGGCHLPTKASI